MEVEQAFAVGLRWLELRGRGFWCRDGLLEVWLAMLVDEIDARSATPNEANAWMAALREDWHAQATTVFDGVMTSSLDAHLSSHIQQQQLMQLCRNLREQLAAGNYRPAGLAHRVGAARWQQADIHSRLLRVADALLYLLGESLAE